MKNIIVFLSCFILISSTGCSKKTTAPEETIVPPEITYLGADVSYNEVAGKYSYHLYFEIDADTLFFFHHTETLETWYWEANPILFPPIYEKKWYAYPTGEENPYALKFKFTGAYNSGLLAIVKAKRGNKEVFASVIVNEERVDVAPELVATQPATTK